MSVRVPCGVRPFAVFAWRGVVGAFRPFWRRSVRCPCVCPSVCPFVRFGGVFGVRGGVVRTTAARPFVAFVASMIENIQSAAVCSFRVPFNPQKVFGGVVLKRLCRFSRVPYSHNVSASAFRVAVRSFAVFGARCAHQYGGGIVCRWRCQSKKERIGVPFADSNRGALARPTTATKEDTHGARVCPLVLSVISVPLRRCRRRVPLRVPLQRRQYRRRPHCR